MTTFTQTHKHTPRWATLIRQERARLKENKAQFGKRFGVSSVSVLYWERGDYEAPYQVTWWLLTLERDRAKLRATRSAEATAPAVCDTCAPVRAWGEAIKEIRERA